MKKFVTIAVLLISYLGISQEIKLKKGDVLVDGNAWIKYQDCGNFDTTCSLLNNEKEELVFFKWISIKGAEPSSKANPDGNLTYVEISFLGLNKKFEIQKRQKDIIEIIYNAKAINEDGTLNEEKIDRIIEKYGTDFSDRLNNSSSNTIIIKQEPSKSGVNINIGG